MGLATLAVGGEIIEVVDRDGQRHPVSPVGIAHIPPDRVYAPAGERPETPLVFLWTEDDGWVKGGE